MIDDIELKAVQHVCQDTAAVFAEQHIVGLDGTLHQKLGRRSHRVELRGLLLPDTATDDLKSLQEKSSKGDEVTFTADITTALSIDKMVIERFSAEQHVGPAGQIAYEIVLVESRRYRRPRKSARSEASATSASATLASIPADSAACCPTSPIRPAP